MCVWVCLFSLVIILKEKLALCKNKFHYHSFNRVAGTPERNKTDKFGQRGVFSPKYHPSGRRGGCVYVDHNMNSVFLFGGQTDFASTDLMNCDESRQNAMGDLWSFHLTNNQWRHMNGGCQDDAIGTQLEKFHIDNLPSSRSSAGCVVHDRLLYLLGGDEIVKRPKSACDAPCHQTNELWVMDIDLLVWKRVKNSTENENWVGDPTQYDFSNEPMPKTHQSCSLTYTEDSILCYGGYNSYSNFYDDLVEYNITLDMYRKQYSSLSNTLGEFGKKGSFDVKNKPPASCHVHMWWHGKILYIKMGFSRQGLQDWRPQMQIWAWDFEIELWNFVFGYNETTDENEPPPFWGYFVDTGVFDPRNKPDFFSNSIFGAFPYEDDSIALFISGSYKMHDEYYEDIYFQHVLLYSTNLNQWNLLGNISDPSTGRTSALHIIDVKNNVFSFGVGIIQKCFAYRSPWCSVSEYSDIFKLELCNGKGIFSHEDINKCICNSWSFGDHCEHDLQEYLLNQIWWIVTIIVVVLGLTLFLYVAFICISGISYGIWIIANQRKKLEKIGDIDDLDLYLEEQKITKGMDKLDVHQFSKDLMIIDEKEVKLKQFLDQGSSVASVFTGTWQGKEVAVKLVQYADVEEEINKIKEFEKEISLMASLKHPNIILFYGALVKYPKIGYVMEFCHNGDLGTFLESYKMEKRKPYPFAEKIRMILEISFALKYLHSNKIIHRDLKCKNVLVSKHLNCKVMDFGLSKFFGRNSKKTMTKGIGTSYYMSPEIVLGKSYSEKTDVFSFGIMLFEIFVEKKPYEKFRHIEGVEFKVASNPFFRPLIDRETVPSFVKKLSKSCWKEKENDRPSFTEIIELIEKSKLNDPIVIYMKLKDQNDEELEDFLLHDFTLNGIRSVAKKKYKRERFVLYSRNKRNDLKIIKDDYQVSQMKDDHIVIVEFVKKMKSLKESKLEMEVTNLKLENKKMEKKIIFLNQKINELKKLNSQK